jgi:hypothetical protein
VRRKPIRGWSGIQQRRGLSGVRLLHELLRNATSQRGQNPLSHRRTGAVACGESNVGSGGNGDSEGHDRLAVHFVMSEPRSRRVLSPAILEQQGILDANENDHHWAWTLSAFGPGTTATG